MRDLTLDFTRRALTGVFRHLVEMSDPFKGVDQGMVGYVVVEIIMTNEICRAVFIRNAKISL